jgi:hypothetical protein
MPSGKLAINGCGCAPIRKTVQKFFLKGKPEGYLRRNEDQKKTKSTHSTADLDFAASIPRELPSTEL